MPVDSAQLCHLLKHQNSSSHKSCVAKYLGLASAVSAPPVAQFKQVYDMIVEKGSATCQGLPGIGKKDKVLRMIRALASARKKIDMTFLAKAKSITLVRDVAEGKMGLRFVGVDVGLHRRCGLLGIHRMTDHSSAGLVRGTIRVLKRFCTGPRGSR